MKDNTIYRAMGDINPDLLDRYDKLKAERETGKKKMNWIAVAACCVLLMGAGVVTGLTDLPQNISRFFGMEDETKIKYLASAATSVDMLIEGEQGDIHIKEVMGDHNSVYIFFDFIAPEGTVLDGDDYLFSRMEDGLGDIFRLYGFYCLEDEDKTDNIVSFARRIQSDESLNGKEISLYFRDLGSFKVLYNEDNTEVIGFDHVDYKGEWQAEPFKLKFTDQTNQYKLNQLLSANGGEFELTLVAISPFAVTFEGTIHQQPLERETFDWVDWEIYKFTLHYADGSSEVVEASGGMGEDTFSVFSIFRPVLTQEIVAVTYMGERIELK